MPAESQAEHDRRRPEEQIFAFLGGEQVAGDVLDPLIRSQFHGADQKVSEEQDEATEPEIGAENSHFASIGRSYENGDSAARLDLEMLMRDESPDNKSIIQLMCQGYSRAEIGKRLNMDPKMVSAQKEAIFKRIRKLLEDENGSFAKGGRPQSRQNDEAGGATE